jgi:glucokinase
MDCGGTNIRLAHGISGFPDTITSARVVPTRAELSAGELQQYFLSVIDSYIADEALGGRVRSINIAIAGQIDMRRGIVRASPNLPSLKNAPLGGWVRERFGCDVFLDNDVRAAALGELTAGNAQVRDMVCLYWGTGIGGGIVVNGALLRGVENAAAEVGHVKYLAGGRPCKCGGRGCFEAYAGGWAMQEIARECAAAQPAGWGAAPTTEDVFMLAAAGFSPALEIRDHAAGLIGLLAANLVVAFNPARLVLGGGITGHYPVIRDIVEKVVSDHVLAIDKAHLTIERSTLGDRAALLGALHFNPREPS